MITICLTYFRSLTLTNLRAALDSIRCQNLTRVERIVVVDNNTDDQRDEIEAIATAAFTVPVVFRSFKHGDPTRTHAWSTNMAVRDASTPWVFFTRADYILDQHAVAKFWAIAAAQGEDWNGFVTSNGKHLHACVEDCRTLDLATAPGVEFSYTCIDAGVWMARRSTFDHVGGLNERLSAWGHAQTHFQYKLHAAGTECVRINETLFFHPAHGGERDIAKAHADLAGIGVTAQELWQRYDGVRPY
jgi:hypothetical protein